MTAQGDDSLPLFLFDFLSSCRINQVLINRKVFSRYRVVVGQLLFKGGVG